MSNTADRTSLRAFLTRLRSGAPAERPVVELPDLVADRTRQVGQDCDWMDRFIRAVQMNGMSVEIASAETLCDQVLAVLRRNNASTAFVEPHTDEMRRLAEGLAAAGIGVQSKPSDGTLFSVAAGVTTVVAAVAETGSLVVESGPGMIRGASLIPPLHIAIVHETQVVADLVDLFARLGDRNTLPANVNIISGASKTADIEGTLVTGVHGPGKVAVTLSMSGPTG